MSVPDVLDRRAEPPVAAPGGRRRRRRPRGVQLALAVGGLLAGGAMLSAAVLRDAGGSSAVFLALVVGGVAALYLGIDRTLKLVRGPRTSTGLWLASAWMAAIVLSAIFADLLPLSEALDTAAAIDTPSLLRPDLLSEHPFGTDKQGLDILGGVIYGARVSLIVGFGAVLIGLLVGGLLGLLSGFYRGKLEAVINFFTDAVIAFPPLILLMGLVAVLEPSVRNVTLGLAVLGIPLYIRIARANTMVAMQKDYVLQARVLGARNGRLMFKEVLPNVVSALLSYGFVVVAVLIVAEASLSYLGLSVQRPNPTWGNMIAAGQDGFQRHPHLVFVPGLVLFLTVFALTRIGEAARVAWEPRKSDV